MPPPSKKTKLAHNQPAEIVFDPSARQDYLTGFHKRKVARIEHARDVAAKRAREEKIKERRQMREQRKEDLEQHVKDVNKELRKLNPDMSDSETSGGHEDVEDEWTGLEQNDGLDGKEEEYVDEDKYTTVTVEAMEDGTTDELSDSAGPNNKTQPANGKTASTGKHTGTKVTKGKPSRPNEHAKRKKKKFRYETKAERKETRFKQKAKNLKAAKARKDG